MCRLGRKKALLSKRVDRHACVHRANRNMELPGFTQNRHLTYGLICHLRLAIRRFGQRSKRAEGRRSDKGPIRLAMGTLERQKKPSVASSFNRLLPSSVLSRQRLTPRGRIVAISYSWESLPKHCDIGRRSSHCLQHPRSHYETIVDRTVTEWTPRAPSL
jgi:hypothetical protein